MLIQAALNGNRSVRDHPRVPGTPSRLAAEARSSVEAGAAAVHVHPRDHRGSETLATAEVGAAVRAIRAACPGIPVGVTTGAWIEPDPETRLTRISAWSEPDFASVNFDEPGAAAVALRLLERGIGVEAGLSSGEAAAAFVAFDRADACLRVLLEPPEPEPAAAAATVASIEVVLDRLRRCPPRLLHGVDGAAWAMVDLAARRGYDTRMGFEDTLTFPDGREARSNGELVREAARRVGRVGP